MQQLKQLFSCGKFHWVAVGLVQAQTERIQGMNVDAFGQSWFITDQPPQLRVQRMGQGGEQHAGIGMSVGKIRGTMQSHDSLTSTC